MKRSLITLLVLMGIGSAGAQSLKAYSANNILNIMVSKDTVYVINFWATWCPPCVQELPDFNELAETYKSQPVKILMVSLDFPDSYPIKLQTFIDRKKMVPEVVWLSDTDPNRYIPKIEPKWEGSIPATLIVWPDKYRKFIEGQTSFQEVSGILNTLLK